MAIDWQELLKQAFAGNGGMAPVPTPRPAQPPALTPMGVTPEPEKHNPIASFFSSKDDQGNERHGSHFARLFQEDPDKQDALSNGLIQMGAAMAAYNAPSTNPAAASALGGLGFGIGQGNKAYTQYGQDQADIAYKKAQAGVANAKLAAAQKGSALAESLGDLPRNSDGSIDYRGLSPDQLYAYFKYQVATGDDAGARDTLGMIQQLQQTGAKNGMLINGDGKFENAPGYVGALNQQEEGKSSGRKAGEAPFETTSDITNFKFAQEHPAFIDPAKQRADAAKATADEKAADDARQASQDDFKKEQDLRKEYTASPIYKRYDTVRGSFDRIQSGAAQDNGAGDLGIIYNYMKMLDPGSVVREGEFATAEQAQGVPTQVLNLYNKLINGERLTPEQRTTFVNASGDLYKKEKDKMDELNGQYTDIAKSKNIDVTKVITEPKDYTKRAPPRAGDVFTTDEGKQVRFKGGNPNDKNNYEPVL
jgi:hypothetical protein